MRLASIFVLVFLAVSSAAFTVGQINDAIKQLRVSMQKCQSAINAFPPNEGTVPQAIPIHNCTVALKADIGKTKDAVDGTPTAQITDSDAAGFLTQAELIQAEPMTVLLTTLLARKQQFNKIGVLPVARKDCGEMGTVVRELGISLINQCPTKEKPQAQALKAKYDKQLDQFNKDF